jgi:rhodanese-related sulfurtransferase
MKSITPSELNTLREANASLPLLDVRTPAEHEKIHVPGVHLLPVDDLDAGALAATNRFAKDKPVYILCHSGSRAERAARMLESQGYRDCVVVQGGTSAWASLGLPVNRGQRNILPLDRQVRLVAGFMALAGALLAWFVAPAFIILSGFVGLGLIVAGATDFCPMAILLAKMPWNQSSRGVSCCTPA